MIDFESAMERVVAGLQQRKVVSEKEKRILAYHEAGHAVMSHLMGDLMPVHEGDDRLPRRRRSVTRSTCPTRIATCSRRRS